MRCRSVLTVCLASVVPLAACGTGSVGKEVEVRHAVLVSDEPLGDVVRGELEAGDEVTALCFVPEARTNTGATGSAVRIEDGRLSGYAAVTTLPARAADRVAVFDVDERALRDALPACDP